MLDFDDALLLEYLAESSEQLVIAEADLLAIGNIGCEIDEQRMNRIFRIVHTIKGGSGFFGLTNIGELAHHAENVLALVRSGALLPTSESVAVLLRTIDSLMEMVNHPASSNQKDTRLLQAELAYFCAQPDNPRNTEPEKSVSTAERNPLRILLVEDDFTSRILLQTFLSKYGDCHLAVNGNEAVSAFANALEIHQSYDLVCMDIRMPEMDGRQAVRELRTMEQAKGILSSRGATIIMMTSVREIREVFRCFEELCDAYLMKPIDLAQLLHHLREFELVS